MINDMNIICSETGSAGNFSFITDGKTNIAIDCGIRYATANKMCNYKILEVLGVLITHSHT